MSRAFIVVALFVAVLSTGCSHALMLRDAAGDLPRGKGRVVKPDVADAIVFAGISIVGPGALTITVSDPPK